MSYTPEQFARLPKWAQKEISIHEHHVANLKARIEELNDRHPDSNVLVSSHVYGDASIPKDSEVDFYLGDGPYRKYQDMISVQHLRTKGRKVLRLSASGQLIVRPTGGCNVIEVTTERQ